MTPDAALEKAARTVCKAMHPEGNHNCGWDGNRCFKAHFCMCGPYHQGIARAALASTGAPQGWQPIETFDDEPHGQANRVLIACGTVVGEAWFRDPDGANDTWESGWWWAGTGPGDYHASLVVDTNDAPTHWMPLPSAPTSPSAEEGGA